MLLEKEILSQRRLAQAKQCLVSAKTLLSINDQRGAVNRAYYAVFHAMRSVLILEGKDFAKHSGVISYFRKTYTDMDFTANVTETDIDDYTITFCWIEKKKNLTIEMLMDAFAQASGETFANDRALLS